MTYIKYLFFIFQFDLFIVEEFRKSTIKSSYYLVFFFRFYKISVFRGEICREMFCSYSTRTIFTWNRFLQTFFLIHPNLTKLSYSLWLFCQILCTQSRHESNYIDMNRYAQTNIGCMIDYYVSYHYQQYSAIAFVSDVIIVVRIW